MRSIHVMLLVSLTGCSQPPSDPNSVPRVGPSGLPSNCRAFVQYAIDEYRAGKYSADETFNSIERNCGVVGHLWGS